ncbi:MAG: lysine--tRNA ligase [bacterium]|nr:lysine--tRNA ligase [bacterium]
MLEDLIKERLKKKENLEHAGVDCYPAKVKRDHKIEEVLKNFLFLSLLKKKVAIVGRILALRGQGGIIFIDIYDGSGTMQAVVSKKNFKDFALYKENLDLGDFISVQGTVFKTKAGQKSLQVNSLSLATKSLRPIPSQWYGIQDEEEKLRKRYLDILLNPEIRDMFKKRAIFWNSIREFLIERDFLEVETPVLENKTGGAEARPFITHHNALDIDVFLRISMGELWQKKLMVAGYEKTFEIGRQFRNEGMDAEHLQDYTQMEFYWAYADYEMGMNMVEELFKHVALKTFGKLKFTIGEFEVDLGKKWERYDFVEIVKKQTGIDVMNTNLEEIKERLKGLRVEYSKEGFNITRGIDSLWKYCRKQIGGPGFLVNVPVVMEPLAKRKEDNKELVQRFQVIIAGSELGKGYSELNDPVDQMSRFNDQAELRNAGDEEAQMKDEEFVEALEYGMPPTCGFGMSERVFSFLMNKSARECQIFPLLRPKKGE